MLLLCKKGVVFQIGFIPFVEYRDTLERVEERVKSSLEAQTIISKENFKPNQVAVIIEMKLRRPRFS